MSLWLRYIIIITLFFKSEDNCIFASVLIILVTGDAAVASSFHRPGRFNAKEFGVHNFNNWFGPAIGVH